MLKKIYWSQQHGYDYLTTWSVEKTKARVLVFGSSRAVNIFDPHIIKKELGTTCFNAGRVGQSVFYHYAVLKAALERYTPEVVVLSLDVGDFSRDRRDYDRLSQLLPYYDGHPEIRSIVNLKGPFEPIKMISSVYPYNSMLLPMIKTSVKVKPHDRDENGFIPLHKKIVGPPHKLDYADFALLDSNKVNVYKAFISDCKKSGISLFIVCPPYRIEAEGEDCSLALAKGIAEQNNIEFFDHSNDPDYSSSMEYFADFRHLNSEGAGIFSKQVAERIKTRGMQFSDFE